MDPKKRKLMVKVVGVIGIAAILLGVLLPALTLFSLPTSNPSTTQEAPAGQ